MKKRTKKKPGPSAVSNKTTANLRTGKSEKAGAATQLKRQIRSNAARARTRGDDALERHQRNEASLKKAEALGNMGYWEWNILTNDLIWSDQVFKLYGLDPLKGKPRYEVVIQTLGSECRDRFIKAVEDAVHKGAAFDSEYRLIGLDGVERFTHTVGEVIRDHQGKPLSMFGIVQDITGRKQAEEKLKAGEERLRDAQRIAQIGNWEYNVVNDKLVWSDELYRMFSISRENVPLSLELFLGRVHPEDREALRRQIDSGLSYRSDYRIVLPDGTVKYIHEEVELQRDADGKLVRSAGTAQDITERKQFEENIRQNEQFIRNILDTVDEGFIVIDRDYRIVTANKAYCGQVGRSCDEVIGRFCYEISHRTNRPCYEMHEECAVRQVFAAGEPSTVLHRHEDAGGHILYVEAKAYPLKDASGQVASVIETITNITEKHLL